MCIRDRKWLGVTVLCGLFVACAVFMIMRTEDKLIGWFVFAFFGFGLIISIIQLIKPATLILTQDGFEQSSLGRKLNCSWHDVSEFGVTRIQRSNYVSFSRQQDEGKMLSNISKGITGGHSGTLGDTFGMKAHDLADLMNRYRDQALRR